MIKLIFIRNDCIISFGCGQWVATNFIGDSIRNGHMVDFSFIDFLSYPVRATLNSTHSFLSFTRSYNSVTGFSYAFHLQTTMGRSPYES